MLSIVKDVLTRLYAALGGDIYYINSGEALPARPEQGRGSKDNGAAPCRR